MESDRETTGWEDGEDIEIGFRSKEDGHLYTGLFRVVAPTKRARHITAQCHLAFYLDLAGVKWRA